MNRNKEDNTIPLQEEYPDFEELPAYYSTIFKAMLPDSFQNISEKIKGRKCIFSTFVTDSTFFTDEGILKMAGYKLGGTRIVITQHAPPYIFVAKLSTVYLEGFQHALITWGNLPFSRKLRHSAPNLNYARLYNKHHLTVASVLYIMDSEYLSPPNFEAALYTYTPKVRSFHKKLIGALDKNVKDAMYMRPRPCYTSFDTEAWIRKTFPDIPIHEASISLLKALRHCKLSIVTYMGSTFNQALTLNSPVIWVLDRSEYLFTQEALDLLKHMQDVKIYFSDPLQAAKHINNVWSDIDSWWDSKEVQAVRAECLKIDMGLPCKKPLRKWIKAIKAL
ncbi:hypothetical protein FACS1894140_4240 [Spirochaetia bacterium]|nr:hypothetical protein FACS1894140_4240 [Spirochaetia bacterium]